MLQVVVLGGGESGVGVALLARTEGHAVRVSDAGQLSASAKTELESAGIPYEDGGHTRDDITVETIVVKSPGIPWEADFVAFAKTRGATVIGEMEFCARYATARFNRTRRIGITGSNGKTTTTLLTTHLLNAAGLRAVACGNVGTSFARLLLEPEAYDWYVLELSSFQLDDIDAFWVSIGTVLNLSPDHLDRYGGSFEAYAAAKYRLKPKAGVWLQSGERLAAAHDPGVTGDFRQVTLPAEFTSGIAITPWGTTALTNAALAGPHNAANASFAIYLATAAIGISRGSAVEEQAQPVLAEALATFRNAPHRLEPIGFIDGVRYVNDSKATNQDSVDKALRSYDVPVVWIVGGEDKGNDYGALEELVHERVRAVVAMGVDNAKIERAFGWHPGGFASTNNLISAMSAAQSFARAGDVVLLSPACASFDLFRNYIDRGDQFRAWVRAQTGFTETL